MGDNPVSPNATSPRKQLPIPNPGSCANTNSTLKGILIKPKRILPTQPDNQKLKRLIQENGTDCKLEDTFDTVSSGLKATGPKGDDGVSVNLPAPIGPKVHVPKLQIDVTKLKTFQLQGSAVGKKDKKKTDLNENDIFADEKVNKVNSSSKPQSDRSGISPPIVLKDNTEYSSAVKVKEWCSARNGNSGKMASDHSETKPMERSIRSPSPKCNTTWDRSSSGYSSDERADPRSPPPSHSASVSVSSKTETEATNEDDVNISQSADVTDEKTDTEDDTNDEDTLKFKDESQGDTNCLSTSTTIDDLFTSNNDCKAVTLTPTPVGVEAETTGEQCDNCDSVNNQSAERNDTTGSCVNFSFDNSIGVRQPTNSRRPVWTATSNTPSNSRIQYRKSVSESTISLRHPCRQNITDSNFDGLAVCGKSLAQQSVNSSSGVNGLPGGTVTATTPDIVDGATVGDTGAHLVSPSSAFTPIERPVKLLDLGADDTPATNRARGFRPPPATCKSPRDFKSMGFPINAKLTLKDDIRKSLHDLQIPRRNSVANKSLPIRARHTLNVTSTSNSPPVTMIETLPSQVHPTHSATLPRPITFGKKMWRAPSGQPENAHMRPFSPFGGTLPPAKIKEQEQKKHHEEND